MLFYNMMTCGKKNTQEFAWFIPLFCIRSNTIKNGVTPFTSKMSVSLSSFYFFKKLKILNLQKSCKCCHMFFTQKPHSSFINCPQNILCEMAPCSTTRRSQMPCLFSILQSRVEVVGCFPHQSPSSQGFQLLSCHALQSHSSAPRLPWGHFLRIQFMTPPSAANLTCLVSLHWIICIISSRFKDVEFCSGGQFNYW